MKLKCQCSPNKVLVWNLVLTFGIGCGGMKFGGLQTTIFVFVVRLKMCAVISTSVWLSPRRQLFFHTFNTETSSDNILYDLAGFKHRNIHNYHCLIVMYIVYQQIGHPHVKNSRFPQVLFLGNWTRLCPDFCFLFSSLALSSGYGLRSELQRVGHRTAK